MKVKQYNYNYTKQEGIPEVMLRVELLQKRLPQIFKKKDLHILEVGLGTGDVTLMLTAFFKNITCVEPDKKVCDRVLERLKKNNSPSIKIIRATIEKAKLSKEGYDCILLIGVLEHLKDSLGVLKRLSKYLRSGGRICILVNLSNSIHRWLGVTMGIISKPSELADSDKYHGHIRLYTPSKLRNHVKSARLKVLYELPFYLKPLPTSMLTSLSMEIHKGLYLLGQKFPEFASYMYIEVTH